MSKLRFDFNSCLHTASEVENLLIHFDFQPLDSGLAPNHTIGKKDKKTIDKNQIFIINSKFVQRWTDTLKWLPPRISGPWSICVQDTKCSEILVKKVCKFTYESKQYTLIVYSSLNDEINRRCCKLFKKENATLGREITFQRTGPSFEKPEEFYKGFIKVKEVSSECETDSTKLDINDANFKQYYERLYFKRNEEIVFPNNPNIEIDMSKLPKHFKFHEYTHKEEKMVDIRNIFPVDDGNIENK